MVSKAKVSEENEPLLDTEREEITSIPLVTRSKISPLYMVIPIFCITTFVGASIAPMLQLLTEIFCNEYYQSKQSVNSTMQAFDIPIDPNIPPIEECSIPEVQSMVSSAMALIRILTSVSVLLTAGWFGEESDFRGRLFVVRTSSIGMILYTSIIILVAKYQNVVGIIPIFIAPILKGLLAGEHTVYSAFNSYVADVTEPRDRTLYMSFMMAAMFSGMAVGPLLASWVLKKTESLVSIFIVNLIGDIVFLLYALFILPESNPFIGHHSTKKRKTIKESLNIFSALHIIVRTIPQHVNKYALYQMTFIMFLITIIMIPPTLLYAMLKFGWTAYEGGFYMSMSSFTRLIALMIVLPILTRLFKRPNQSHRRDILFDVWMMRAGYLIDAVGLALYPIVTTSGSFYAAGAIQALSMIAQPSTRSLLTMMVKPTEVGKLFGAISVVDAFAGIVSQFCVNSLYAATVKTMPGLTFYFCAFVALITSLIAFFVHPQETNDDELEGDATDYAQSSTADSATTIPMDRTVVSNELI
ncbi:major facilitator superfamily domain-containing protein [Umbelopsis sp. PMI_123]|nr:major facilitator superfamily domain-containing protein [Umbelopsis sp. PMI_123]